MLDSALRMTPEEMKRMNELVLLIQAEKDHQRFGELVDELNALLDDCDSRSLHKTECATGQTYPDPVNKLLGVRDWTRVATRQAHFTATQRPE